MHKNLVQLKIRFVFEFMFVFLYVFSSVILSTPEECEVWEFQKHCLWFAF